MTDGDARRPHDAGRTAAWLALCPPDLGALLRADEADVLDPVRGADAAALVCCYRLLCRHLLRLGWLPLYGRLPEGWRRIRRRVDRGQFAAIRAGLLERVESCHDRHLALRPVDHIVFADDEQLEAERRARIYARRRTTRPPTSPSPAPGGP
jgi:hypothetical protein